MALAEDTESEEGGYGEGLASEADRTIARGALTDIQKATQKYQSTYDKLQAEREQQVQSQRQILDTTIEKLMASRQPDGVTPLLAAASGFLAPTRTGGTGESFGNALSRMTPALEQEERQRTALAQNVGNLQFQGAGLEGGLLKERQGDLMRQIIESQKSGSRLAASLAKGPKENQMQAAVRLMNDPNTSPTERAIWQAYVTKHTERAPKEPKNEFGAGVEGASLSIINRLAPKISDGTATPDEQRSYAIAYSAASQPRISVGADGTVVSITPQLPKGLPPPGLTGAPAAAPATPAATPDAAPIAAVDAAPKTEQIAPGVTRTGDPKATKITMEDAAKASGIEQAQRELSSVSSKLFKEDGSVNNGLLLQAQRVGPVEGAPRTPGREMRQQFQRAIEIWLRINTGAAAPEQEVARYMNMYFPSPLDDAKSAKNKVSALQTLINATMDKFGAGRPQFSKSDDKPTSAATEAPEPQGVWNPKTGKVDWQ